MSVLAQLHALATNLWWTWDTEATALWPLLDAETWERTGHNPVALLAHLDGRIDPAFTAPVDRIHARMCAALGGARWADEAAPEVQEAGVLYLSMEFGLHESLPLYSGGLGVLAGDHLRSASDLGIQMTGVGLLWREGYFRQRIEDGQQVAWYERIDETRWPLTRVTHDDAPLCIEVPLAGETARLAVWRLDVGRVPLFLLDADVDGNLADVRALTRRLYSGGGDARIRQETLLGLGAIRLARTLGLRAGVVHLNEGHCAFAAFALAAEVLPEVESWEAALDAHRQQIVFTTHTPVPAGHDRFTWEQVDQTLGPWRDQLGLARGDFMQLGRVDPADLDETLCMTVVALRTAASANGVSHLHGRVSRDMWAALWPEREHEDVPIGHVTNGVHPIFWVSDASRALFDAHLPGWRQRPWDPAIWARAQHLDADALLHTRNANRAALMSEIAARTGARLDPDALTIGFARRFATYKRGDLVFRDPERLADWLDRGAQLVFAGKAHPEDQAGQAVVARVAAFAAEPRFAGRVVFLPDYDIAIGRALTAGADLWLNNPRRPHEASGTSGQKVIYNGGLNLSVLDGWWVEGHDGTNGWAIGDGREWDDAATGDAEEATRLYEVLEREVWAEWTDQAAWLARIRRSLCTCGPAFTSHRMVRDYVLDWYRSAAP